MAESAVQALALVGDESTLRALDDLTRRYRVKPKNIGQTAQEALRAAADRLGITLDELGDRIVPALGFKSGQPRIVEAGSKRIEATIGPDFKLRYRDTASNKPVKSLPASASKEVKAEFKELAAAVRDAAKAQTGRLEDQLVRGRRWPVARWRELFLGYPVLFPFAVRLVWGQYDESGHSAHIPGPGGPHAHRRDRRSVRPAGDRLRGDRPPAGDRRRGPKRLADSPGRPRDRAAVPAARSASGAACPTIDETPDSSVMPGGRSSMP